MVSARGVWCPFPLLLALSACDPTLTFTVSRTTPLEVPACGSAAGEQGGAGVQGDVQVDTATEVKNQGLESGDVRAIYLRRLELRVDTPAGSDLSYVKEMDVYVDAPKEQQALVASQDRFPAGQQRVALEVTGVNLAPYATASRMTLRLKADVQHCPAETQRLLVRTTMEVQATPQGLVHGAQRVVGSP